MEIEGKTQDRDRDRRRERREGANMAAALDDAFAQNRADRVAEKERGGHNPGLKRIGSSGSNADSDQSPHIAIDELHQGNAEDERSLRGENPVHSLQSFVPSDIPLLLNSVGREPATGT
jgi:hypothetical protein